MLAAVRQSSALLPVKPNVTLFARVSSGIGVPLDALVGAMRVYLDDHFVPVWGTPATVKKARGFVRGAWAIGIFDSADQADDEGYHDLTPDGLPFARVFLPTVLADHTTLSATISHELAEMLVDPIANLAAERSDRVMYDFEVADPVEEETFEVRGMPVSDFVYPAWFEGWHRPHSRTFDHMHKVHRPFQILRNGYARRFRGGKWSDVWGSRAKAARFHDDERAGERREMRSGRARRVSNPRPRRGR
jgi:hypothetical protein